MKVNFKHLEQKEMTYISHFLFAASIAGRLFVSCLLLFVHSFLPWLEFNKFDIEKTISYLKDKHER